MKKLVLFLLCVAAPVSAVNAKNISDPREITLSEYLARSNALAQRPHNQSTPEYVRLQTAIIEAARLARNERQIARREGRAPRACLSPSIRATDTRELSRHFGSIPADQQNITLADAYMQLMSRKFPCSKSS